MPREPIAAVAQRTALMHLVAAGATGVACAAAMAAMLLALGMSAAVVTSASVLAGAAAAAVSWIRGARSRGTRAAAAELERQYPSGNVIVTAEQLGRGAMDPPVWVAERVRLEAARALEHIRPSDVVSSRPAAGAIGAAVLASVLLLAVATGVRLADVIQSVSDLTTIISPSAEPIAIAVSVEPPAYARRAAQRFDNPARLDVLAGSRITFILGSRDWRVRLGEQVVTGSVTAERDGYFAVERTAPATEAVLIPLRVTVDRKPDVRVDAPGKDLLLPAAAPSLAVRVSAADDLGLHSLEVRYTKVTGSGEQFEFADGRAPLTLERVSDREWRGRSSIDLAAMRLAPGDSLVYHAVARDQRPGAEGAAVSDTYYLEIAGPGQVAVEGVDMPADMERYALSQQMIVLKIERLRARESSLGREALTEEMGAIAAEQRSVRANFIFLLGGHVEDEEEEAEQSHEIQEGRLENTARRDINSAISHMTRAEQGLTAVDTGAALPPARQAVEALQRAFGRSRYLLRALAVRSRLDPSRRLSGDLRGAGAARRDPAEPGSREGEDVRAVFVALMQLTAQPANARGDHSAELRRLAESALRIDSASETWREVARELMASAKESDAARRRDLLLNLLDRVAKEAARGTLPRSPLAVTPAPLERAWALEVRR